MQLGHLETALDFEARKARRRVRFFTEGAFCQKSALRLPEMHAAPILLGQGEPAKCQKWLPFSPESATGQPPKCGNEASSHGGQNAQLRGHWAYLAHRLTLEGRDDDAFAKSLSTARVETKPHQVDAALFALQSPLSKGVILF
jgi:hypothetical protein